MLLPERSIPYKTFVKTAIVLALRNVFAQHPDSVLRKTKVSIDYPNTVAAYPAVIVRFFEREISNAGVGHIEFLVLHEADADYDPDSSTLDDDLIEIRRHTFPFRHFLYNGDIELSIQALSSRDRDLISDALVTTLAMSDPRIKTSFFSNIYSPDFDLDGGGINDNDPTRYNFVNLNTDRIMGFGETQNPAPWLSEDQLVYSSSYRVGIMGEFYSLPPEVTQPAGTVQKVTLLPYIDGLEPVPQGVEAQPAYHPPDTSIDLPAIEDTTHTGQWTDWS